MNNANTEYLYKNFPRLYQQHDLPITQTCLCWGFECGDGWFDLIKRLSERLKEISERTGGDIQAEQVKEKYGTLRFYINGGDEEAYKAIDKAERESEHTCEQCGKPGATREIHGWYRTLCNECEMKRSDN
jgi:hypothetical protein